MTFASNPDLRTSCFGLSARGFQGVSTLDREHSHTEAGNRFSSVGQVLSVRGSQTQISLVAGTASGEGRTTVGKFVAIGTGRGELLGMVTEVSLDSPDANVGHRSMALAEIDLIGEIVVGPDKRPAFRRGVSEYPVIGDKARLITSDDLRVIFDNKGKKASQIGYLSHDETVLATVDPENLVNKHFAVLGSTGVGKSSGVSVILSNVTRSLPDLRVLLLDSHNEYGRTFGDQASTMCADNFKLPFWLFNFEELTDVFYGGRPAVEMEVDILAELIPLAKSQYQQQRSGNDRSSLLRKQETRSFAFTIDTPVPYLIQDLLSLIDDRMGKLENRSSRMAHHRLAQRIEAVRNDARYAFMFANANVGGDTMADILGDLFRRGDDQRPITVFQLASLPTEVVDAVVCVMSRLAFDLGMWSDGALPLLIVCEEAHRFAPADRATGFEPSRRALARIAKEGRKYGVYLGLVSQRPAELDPTIISQCNTLFAMRMANDHDQRLLRSAVSDAAANLLAFVPSLGTGEVIGFGEGMSLPVQFRFTELPADRIPRNEAISSLVEKEKFRTPKEFLAAVVERWRSAGAGKAGEGSGMMDPETGAETQPTHDGESRQNRITDAVEAVRQQYLANR